MQVSKKRAENIRLALYKGIEAFHIRYEGNGLISTSLSGTSGAELGSAHDLEYANDPV